MDGITRGLAIARVVVTNALQSRLVECKIAGVIFVIVNQHLH